MMIWIVEAGVGVERKIEGVFSSMEIAYDFADRQGWTRPDGFRQVQFTHWIVDALATSTNNEPHGAPAGIS